MPTHDHTTDARSWDAADAGCAELIVGLAGQLTGMAAGAVLRVTARSPGAPADIPAWCRLTGHRLLSADHPRYLIQRRNP